MRRGAAALVILLVVVLSPAGIAGENEAGGLIDRSRAALTRQNTASIRALVRADRSAAYEAVHRLGAEGSDDALRLAEAIAAAYAEVYSDRRLLDRIPQFRAWTRDDREARAAAVALKTEARAEYGDGRPESALEKLQTACATFERIRDEREEAWCRNALAGTRSILHKGDGAIRELQQARDAIDRAGDLRLLAAVESNLGLSFRGTGDLASARRELERAVRLTQELGDRREEAGHLVTLALIERELGEIDGSAARLRGAVAIAHEMGDGATEALGLSNLGNLQRDLGLLPAAIADYRKAFEISHRIGEGALEADAAVSLALMLREQGRSAEGKVWLRRAEAVAAGAEDVELRSRIACVKSMTLIEEGSTADALPILDAAVSAAREAGDPGILAIVLECRASGLFYGGRYEEAIADQRAAVDAAVQSSDGSSEAWRRQILAWHLALMGDLSGASAELATAVRLHADRKSGLGRCRALDTLGCLHEKAGDHALARQELEEALKCSAETGVAVDRASSLVDLARLTLKAGPSGVPEALERLDEAARVNREQKNTSGFTECRLLAAQAHLIANRPLEARKVLDALAALGRVKRGVYNEWNYQYLRARLAIAQGQRPAAILACERAVAEVEAMRSAVRPPPWKAAVLDDRIEPYRELVRLYLDDGSVEKAYRVARLAKAREFALKLLPPSLDGDEGPPAGGPAVRVARARVAGRVTRASPSRSDGGAAPLARLRELLHPREALLDLFVLNDRVVAFVVRRESVKARRLSLDAATLRESAEAARYPGRPVPADAPVTEAWRSAMERIAGAVFGSSLEQDLAGADSILIVPNLWLHSIPFGALSFEGNPLLERHVVAVLPSADTLLSRLRRQTTRGGGEVQGEAMLGLGDPEIAGRGSRLPGAASEIRRAASLFAGPSWTGTGPDASEAVYRDRAPRSRFIHLAAHGRVDRLVPSRSRIELAGGRGMDGRLTAEEIAAVPLVASLVTLSGCGTADEAGLAQEDAPGDEREGLPRAFLAAGAGTVVASLWEIDDEAAAEIFPQIYRSLGPQSDPAATLAAVQRAMRSGAVKLPDGRSLDHPFYWAGIVAYGAGR